jgi:hypothetical protein
MIVAIANMSEEVSMRRFIATVALVVSAGGYLLAAPERATFILSNGERKSGIVAFHGGQNENLINGHLNLAQDNAKDLTFPMDQVTVIDFQGGSPTEAELAQLPADGGHLLVMRNGTSQPGRFVNMLGGDTLVWQNQTGQQQTYPIRDVGRVYLNPQSARTVFNYRGSPGAVATAGQVPAGRPVRVDAKQAWTDTGITVNQGDRVSFQSSGQILYGQSPGQAATPDGGAERRANYPDPTAPVGALIGKVGNSAPFGIGSQTQPLVMPASGRLMLGVNDNELGDNSGFFTVVVTRQ